MRFCPRDLPRCCTGQGAISSQSMDHQQVGTRWARGGGGRLYPQEESLGVLQNLGSSIPRVPRRGTEKRYREEVPRRDTEKRHREQLPRGGTEKRYREEVPRRGTEKRYQQDGASIPPLGINHEVKRTHTHNPHHQAQLRHQALPYLLNHHEQCPREAHGFVEQPRANIKRGASKRAKSFTTEETAPRPSSCQF